MEKFKANDNKNEEHEISYRQFNKKLELLNQILSLTLIRHRMRK